MKKPSGPLVLLALAGLLAPIIGGQLQLEVSALEPGFGPFMGALFGSPDAPNLSHMLLGLLVLAALGWAIAVRRVMQAPNPRVALPLIGFFALLVFSVALSGFKMTSLSSLAEWLTYGAAFFAVVACAGRVDGPRLIVMAIFAGCIVLALRGIWEYSRPGTPPDWRIFGGWQHPNALAGMLCIGLMLGLGLTLCLERMASFAAASGTAAIGFALMLTQSKGGFLAAGTGIVALLLLLLVARPTVIRAARVAGVLVAVAALVGALSLRPQAAGTGSPLARVSSVGSSADQSAGVRANLWKTSLSLIRTNMGGYGLNTFQYYSARPGLVMSGIQQAHNSFLQLSVEAGLLSAALLIGFSVMLLWEMLRSSRKLPPDNALLRAGVLAALVASSAHSMVDSDLYNMGIGLAFFLLCGAGLLLSADGVLPELLPRPMRGMLIAMAGAGSALLVYTSSVAYMKSRINGDIAAGDIPEAIERSDVLLGLAPFDGEAHYIRSRLSASPEEAMNRLRTAIRLRPVPRYLRSLAQYQAKTGQEPVALATLEQVFTWDPNNLSAQYMKLELQQASGDRSGAFKTALTLANAVNQPFFAVRPLPEQVPLEPYRAMLYLAEQFLSPERTRKFEQALDGFRAYAVHVEQNVAIGTEPLDKAKDALMEGQGIVEKLRVDYRRAGNAAGLSELDVAAKLFADRLEALSK
ncbi:MAG: O-antigen ligase family protein [Fimbriimonadaceae bacterium]